jgi:hypothetical protein
MPALQNIGSPVDGLLQGRCQAKCDSDLRQLAQRVSHVTAVSFAEHLTLQSMLQKPLLIQVQNRMRI